MAAKRRVAEWYMNELDQGAALVLSGPPGTGKTHLATVVLNAYGVCPSNGALMIGEADLLANVRASYSGDGSTEKMILAQYRRAPLLILDDVGVAYVKAASRAWLEDLYWRILDRRCDLHLPLLVTTNKDLEQLAEWLGARAFSRLAGMMGDGQNYVSLFGVPDYRQRNWRA